LCRGGASPKLYTQPRLLRVCLDFRLGRATAHARDASHPLLYLAVFGAFLRKFTAVLIVSAFACLINAQTFTNGQAARIGIGQLAFTFGASGAQQWLLGGASGVAYANNLLFVADSNVLAATPNNNRVLIFDT